MAESYDRTYHEQVDPITADKRDRVIPRSNIRRLVVPLDVAGNEVPYRLRGDFLYADNNTSGVVTCKLNNTSEDPFPLLAQAGLAEMPFEDIYLTWSAQAGKVLNLFYGYKARFASPSQNIATIGTITNPVSVTGSSGNPLLQTSINSGIASAGNSPLIARDIGFIYGATYQAVSTLVSGNTDQVFAPGTNVNGAIIWAATGVSVVAAAANASLSLHAGTSVPVGFNTNDVLLSAVKAAQSATDIPTAYAELTRAVFVAAGKGVWWINDGAANETFARRRVLYNLL